MTASVTIATAGRYVAGVTCDATACHSNSTSQFYPEHSSSEQVQGGVDIDSSSLLDLLFLKFYW